MAKLMHVWCISTVIERYYNTIVLFKVTNKFCKKFCNSIFNLFLRPKSDIILLKAANKLFLIDIFWLIFDWPAGLYIIPKPKIDE